VDEAVCPSFITASQRTQGRIASELADLRKYTGASKPVARSFRGTAYSPRFNMSGSLAMFDATRLASSIVICFASKASSGRAAIDICHGKTVCVPFDVAAGKLFGAPWRRKAARHSTSPRRARARLNPSLNPNRRFSLTRSDWLAKRRAAGQTFGARTLHPRASSRSPFLHAGCRSRSPSALSSVGNTHTTCHKSDARQQAEH